MTAPSQPGPPNQPGGSGGHVVLIVVLVVLGTMFVACGILCGGLVLVYRVAQPHIEEASARAARRAQDAVRQAADPAAQPPWVNEWMINRTLGPVYSIALDAVATNEKVIEQLGDPIEPVEQPDPTQLFRRTNSGDIRGDSETIEFDVKGPKGAAVVKVIAGSPAADSPPGAPGSFPGQLRVEKITVALKDGTTIDVPPPKDQSAFSPIR
jgi:hypothetical protein